MPHNLLIVWSPRWELGIPILDEQHRGAACVINTLFYHMNHGCKEKILMQLMITALKLAELHASTEEELLLKAGYPKAQEHAQLHQKIDQKIKDTARIALKTGDFKAAPDVFLDVLKEWWLGHICVADKEFVPHILTYLKEQGTKHG